MAALNFFVAQRKKRDGWTRSEAKRDSVLLTRGWQLYRRVAQIRLGDEDTEAGWVYPEVCISCSFFLALFAALLRDTSMLTYGRLHPRADIEAPRRKEPVEDDRGISKAGRGGVDGSWGGLIDKLSAVAVGIIVYILIIRPLVFEYLMAPAAFPMGSNLALAVDSRSTGATDVSNDYLFVDCAADMWCFAGEKSAGSCFDTVPAEVPGEVYLKYTCHADATHQWLSYSHSESDGTFRVGLWESRENAIPFALTPAGDGLWFLQSKYPASGYDLYLSFNPTSGIHHVTSAGEQAVVLVAKPEIAGRFAFVARSPDSSPVSAVAGAGSTSMGSGNTGSMTTTGSIATSSLASSSDSGKSSKPTAAKVSPDGFAYIGCFADDNSLDRDMAGRPAEKGRSEYGGRHQGYDVDSCGRACRSRNFKFFGLQAYTEARKSFCFCGNAYGRKPPGKVPDFECGALNGCGIGPCGESLRNAVYSTGL